MPLKFTVVDATDIPIRGFGQKNPIYEELIQTLERQFKRDPSKALKVEVANSREAQLYREGVRGVLRKRGFTLNSGQVVEGGRHFLLLSISKRTHLDEDEEEVSTEVEDEEDEDEDEEEEVVKPKKLLPPKRHRR